MSAPVGTGETRLSLKVAIADVKTAFLKRHRYARSTKNALNPAVQYSSKLWTNTLERKYVNFDLDSYVSEKLSILKICIILL